jgi:outer membrane receptor protein involved in Fe transport
VRSIGGGNPNLQEEEAETLTVGIVLTPLDNLSVGIDYFNIEIENAIGSFGGGANNILNTCYDPTSAKGGSGTPNCDAIKRRPDGSIESVLTLSQNIASQTLSGVDVAANYNFDVFEGTAAADYLATYTEEADFFPEPGEDAIECAGNFGADCGEPTPEYKHRMTFKWSNDDFTAQLLWRYIGEVNDDAPDTVRSVEKISGYSYFGLSGTYYLGDHYKVTAGVRNLFDKRPPLIGDNDEHSNKLRTPAVTL